MGVLVGLVIAAAVVVALSAWRKGNKPTIDPAIAAAFLDRNRGAQGVTQTASGVQYSVLSAGDGAKPTPSDTVRIAYIGRLTDGTVFDRSAKPVDFGVSDVVPGFSEALQLMPVGARYRVWIPPTLGYGARGAGPIPGNAVLVFDIELLAVNPK
ncbi:FKBP-type peptidyl-prolyl cis-trans isomerase [uncultured Sphingomonas sp.]|uniref:FKBP-type peptidyl-prolyl cis-trans isomerase n=1 Tax=uncultured Sphingomonas sp. TaxID=158754 RepID=UPI0025D24F91|nr:FKBP-type peptidyl-prolyl cis-trans isomerase [uncultured Sphingomonas sp.]